MDHKVDRIEDQPAPRFEPLTGECLDVVFLECFFKVVAQGLEVGIRCAGGNNEAISEGGFFPEIKKGEVLCFFVEQGIAGEAQLLLEGFFGGGEHRFHSQNKEFGKREKSLRYCKTSSVRSLEKGIFISIFLRMEVEETSHNGFCISSQQR